MLTPRYSHAVTDLPFDSNMKSDCSEPPPTTTTTTPSPSSAMAFRGNVWFLTVIIMFAMFSCRKFFNWNCLNCMNLNNRYNYCCCIFFPDARREGEYQYLPLSTFCMYFVISFIPCIGQSHWKSLQIGLTFMHQTKQAIWCWNYSDCSAGVRIFFHNIISIIILS